METSPIVLSSGIPGDEDTEEQRTYLLHFIVLKFARLLLLRHAHTQTDKCTQSISEIAGTCLTVNFVKHLIFGVQNSLQPNREPSSLVLV